VTHLPQSGQPDLPIVKSAEVPFYPFMVGRAGVSGTVVAEVSTDGKKVVEIQIKSGPPLLIDSVRKNIKTWRFVSHQPTRFEVEFSFKLSNEAYDKIGNDIIALNLPTRVEITTKRVQTSDPHN
jgi:outer membrane biosynthesis protein TonB